MGLYHNTIDNGIMNATNAIAANAVPPIQFPNNIHWSHAPDDQKRLRHNPDIWVRPGGIPFGNDYPAVLPDDIIFDDEELKLDILPVEESVPIGAPVRINFTLKNNSKVSKKVPQGFEYETWECQWKSNRIHLARRGHFCLSYYAWMRKKL